MKPGITVVVPTIPPRQHLLNRALASIQGQTLQPEVVIVQTDLNGVGAPTTRDRGLRRVDTEWVAFLDDDDEFYPQHLAALFEVAEEGDADYIWSYFDLVYPLGLDDWGRQQWTVNNDGDPLGHFGKQWDNEHRIQTTITTLVRTELAQEVGFLHGERTEQIEGQRVGEDFLFTCGIADLGAKMVHLPQRTWAWYHWGGNTSGRPWRYALDATYEARSGVAEPGH